MAKTNYNGTATGTSSAQVAAENNGRRSFFFKSKGDAFVLNFGAAATADNVLPVASGETVYFDKNSPFPIEKAINVYCANSSKYCAQADE